MAEQMLGASPETGGRPYHILLEHQLDEASHAIRERIPRRPVVGVVLGSGLGAFAETLEAPEAIPFEDIPHLPRTTVPGHAGLFTMGRLAGRDVACLKGRAHLYEGHPVERVVFGCRLLARLGCEIVLVTNASGGIRADLGPGTFMLITDHLNLTGQNPADGFPAPFVDMTDAYDPLLMESARRAARDSTIPLFEGVYAGVRGPTYETPAEVRMLRTLGADAVGMSTVSEVIALRYAGVRVAGLSCITNRAAGLSGTALSHDEVKETARRAEQALVALMRRWIELSLPHERK